jgi:hypothetical protein
VPELPGAHDLRADAGLEEPREGVVDPAAASGLPAGPPPGGEHPLMQPVAGVAKVALAALTFTGGESVEGNREVVDADE